MPADSSAAPVGKDKAARDMFNAGRTAFNEGLFEDALNAFQRAYELSKRPQLLFNIGMAADSARHDQEALEAFERYLREVPKADNREYAEGRIAILKKAAADRDAAPTPAATAAAAPIEPAPAAAPVAALQNDDTESSSLTGKWWFWTAMGAGVAAIVVTTVVLSSGDPELQKGDVGGVVQTLRFAP